jgi:hypothetical protein
VLFVQGGGDDAYVWDKDIVERLQEALGKAPRITFPKIEGLDALNWKSAKRELGTAMKDLSDRAVIVAHSVGAAAILKLLVEGADIHLRHLFLLAPPYNGADGEWGDDDFSFTADFGKRLPRGLPITLWHSRDDEVMPVANAERYRKKLPQAEVVILDGYGHQFAGSLNFLADAIRGALK